ncbi:MAG TPA: S8 family serine peptidase [Rariglobus sp.]|nr:S8 family serine peptidase [Rariglobus sp.]
MRSPKSSLRILVTGIVALAGLWLAAPHIKRHFAPFHKTTEAGAPLEKIPPDGHLVRRHQAIDPSTLPANTVWTFHDGNNARTYAVALDELYVPAGPGMQRMHSLSPQRDLAGLLAAARRLAAQTGTQPQLVLYPLSGPHDEFSRRIVTMKVHIEAGDLPAVETAAASLGLHAWQTPRYAPGHAIAEVTGDPAEPLRAAAFLASLPGVTSATPLLAHQQAKRTLSQPTDTLFSQQWHLKNTGQQNGTAGVDINVTPVWPTLDGTGVSIGIVDNGLQITHPDLATNVASTGNHNWNDGNPSDPSPNVTTDYHGTSVAGLAAARDNGIGVVGVAPEATLYGLRLIALPETDQDDADAMAWKNDVIQIKNNSWGPPDGYPWILGDAGPLWQSAVKDGTATGRGGLGTIYVFASGNGKADGDQGTKDGYAGNVNVVPVGAITNKGVSAYFSEGGPHLVACAPGDSSTSGLVTTDLVGTNGYNDGHTSSELSDANYTEDFNGTSAAAPIVSGVIALMLEANPHLGWRDVKEILLRSSTQLQPTDVGWVTRDGGQPSLPKIKQHPFYGGGLVNAQAATALASTWTNLGAETILTASSSATQTIPDAGAAVIIPFDLSTGSTLRVENVELTVNITHSYRGDLEIKLTSPDGTVSTFVSQTFYDDGSDYPNWTFTSVRHWGVPSKGTWLLSIRDAAKGYTGQFVSATLKVHGVVIAPPTIALDPTGSVAALGSSVSLTAAGSGENLTYQWSKNGSPVLGATNATLTLPNITLAQAGTYTCTIANAAGGATTGSAEVVVYNATAQSPAVNPGSIFSTSLVAAGNITSFQWFRNGSPLADSSHITGSMTGALVVKSVTTADNGAYTLQAMYGGNPLPTGAITLTVRTPPSVSAPSTFETRLGATVLIPLVSDYGAYTYRYVGLPKGLTYNSLTGAINGRTTATGTFPLVLTATDAFGNVTILSIGLTIEPLPAALVGSFTGTIDRDPSINQNIGGQITFTTTTGGQLTGRVSIGTTSYSFTGALDGAAGDHATASVTIPRKGLSPLHLELDIPLDDTAVNGTLNSTVALIAWHNPWSKTSPATAYAGRYTLALETPAGAGWPAGYSTGILSITTAGSATWTLQPADGTAALKGSTTLSADGTLPFFAPIKTPAGSFLGHLTLPPVSMPDASITGGVSWLREETSLTRYANPDGFGPLAMTLHGGRYTAPAAGVLLLGLPNVAGNVNLEFGGTDVDLGSQAAGLASFNATLNNQNKIIIPKAGVDNPAAIKLSVNAGTGQFSGTFALTDPNPAKPGSNVTRTEKFTGVFLLQDELGAGAFVLPALPSSGNGTRSGSVIFIEAP